MCCLVRDDRQALKTKMKLKRNNPKTSFNERISSKTITKISLMKEHLLLRNIYYCYRHLRIKAKCFKTNS